MMSMPSCSLRSGMSVSRYCLIRQSRSFLSDSSVGSRLVARICGDSTCMEHRNTNRTDLILSKFPTTVSRTLVLGSANNREYTGRISFSVVSDPTIAHTSTSHAPRTRTQEVAREADTHVLARIRAQNRHDADHLLHLLHAQILANRADRARSDRTHLQFVVLKQLHELRQQLAFHQFPREERADLADLRHRGVTHPPAAVLGEFQKERENQSPAVFFGEDTCQRHAARISKNPDVFLIVADQQVEVANENELAALRL